MVTNTFITVTIDLIDVITMIAGLITAVTT
jgi:hypothetical protein